MLPYDTSTKAAGMVHRKVIQRCTKAATIRVGSQDTNTNLAVHVRPWCPDKDLLAVGSLWEEALLLRGWTSFGSQLSTVDVSQLRARAQSQLQRSHQRKLAAAEQARVLKCEAVQLLTGSAHAQMGQPALPTALAKNHSTAVRQKLSLISESLTRLRRKRMWMCMVATATTCEKEVAGTSTAETGQSHALCGYILLSLAQPLALLPPPFPSRAPLLLQVDALAVSSTCRRQGVGTALLAAAEKLAMRWGRQSLWLEVDAANHAAVALYVRQGYHVSHVLGWPRRKKQKLLMCKNLPQTKLCGRS